MTVGPLQLQPGGFMLTHIPLVMGEHPTPQIAKAEASLAKIERALYHLRPAYMLVLRIVLAYVVSALDYVYDAMPPSGFVYKSYFAMGGVWVGGSSAGWVGLKLWTPPPSYNFEGFLGWAPATLSFFGHRSLVWLFAGAPFCCVVVQVAGVQVAIFHMADFFLITC